MRFKNELLKCNLSPTLSEFSRNGKVCKTNLRKFKKKVKRFNKRKAGIAETCCNNFKNKVSSKQGRYIDISLSISESALYF